MRDTIKKTVRSPLFLPILSAPLLFGFGALLLLQRDGGGTWYYVLYFLLHVLSAALFFLATHRVFCAVPTAGMPRALKAAFPILISLSVYHFFIAFYDAYSIQYEDAPAALVYALLSLFTDAIVAEWLLLLLSVAACYLFFLRSGLSPWNKRAARLLSALLYFAYLLVGRVSEYLSYVSSHFGVAGESETVSFLLFAGADLLLAALGYLVLFLCDRTSANGEVNG